MAEFFTACTDATRAATRQLLTNDGHTIIKELGGFGDVWLMKTTPDTGPTACCNVPAAGGHVWVIQSRK
jgi:hypothetical protein